MSAREMWIRRKYDTDAVALCGESGPFDVVAGADGHDKFGSAPEVMCPDCIQILDIISSARERREQAATEVLGGVK
ncbi:hypothetical protein F8M49_25055 [Rhodococcus zopfii]|uniref:Uncharacterized protein n=1 Tax=Rhodococcus zopfii TaxID=43772 RepID=A0ABU3WV43_9NOCA|nr:hypothetical protein [Rhodococcus zopfii]